MAKLNLNCLFRVSGFSLSKLKEAHGNTKVKEELLLNLKCEKIHCVKGLQSKVEFRIICLRPICLKCVCLEQVYYRVLVS